MPRGGESVRSGVLAAFPKSSLDGAEVSSPRTSVSPVRPSFTNESREREDDEMVTTMQTRVGPRGCFPDGSVDHTERAASRAS